MLRIAPPEDRSEFSSEEDLTAFDFVVQTSARQANAPAEGFKVQGYYGALLNSPPYAAAQIRAAYALRSVGNREGSYSHADREWVDQVLSEQLGCYKFIAYHTKDALSLGVRPEAIIALWEGREEDLTERERLLERYIRQVLTGTVDDETWKEMRADLGDRGLLDFTLFIGHLLVVARMHQALGADDDVESRAAIVQLVHDIQAGKVEIDDAVDAVRVGR